MQNLSFGEFSLAVDFAAGHIDSVFALGKERLCAKMPLFSIGLRKKDGSTLTICTYDAKMCRETDDGALYGDFPVGQISVRVFLAPKNNELEWRISVENTASDLLCEWVDFPYVTLPALRENSQNGNGGEILYPYNEGVLVSDIDRRESSLLSNPTRQ